MMKSFFLFAFAALVGATALVPQAKAAWPAEGTVLEAKLNEYKVWGDGMVTVDISASASLVPNGRATYKLCSVTTTWMSTPVAACEQWLSILTASTLAGRRLDISWVNGTMPAAMSDSQVRNIKMRGY